jgi:hypothetical protein
MRYLRQLTPWTRAIVGVLALAVAAIAVTVASASDADSEDRFEPRGDVALAPPPDLDVVGDFKDCMSEHGVDVPEPGEPFDAPRGTHAPSAEERQAFEACGNKLPRPPAGAVVFGGRPDSEAFEKFRDCMSDHGVDVPEPPARPRGRGLHEPSAEQQDAFEACRDQLPAPPIGACRAPGRPPTPGMSDDN